MRTTPDIEAKENDLLLKVALDILTIDEAADILNEWLAAQGY
jgi:hypothetical protein